MADRVGERFGNYRLVGLLGKGGFADVYLGEHIHLASLVAVKILHTQLAMHEQVEFLQEARLIASLEHPSIVRVLDCAIERDSAFLIMNYAPHGTLRQRHPKGTRLPLAEILTYIKQAASALQYAHDRRVIHRDVKPENMLLGPHYEVLLSDFGIAVVSGSTSSQSTKAAAGTVAYMAPEQIIGKPRITSDQYALGIVVYEWLCGERPFHGSFPELCAQHLYASPPPLRSKNPQISPAVEAVVLRALAKEAQQRFSSVQDFVHTLEQADQQVRPELTSTFIVPPPTDASALATAFDNGPTARASWADSTQLRYSGDDSTLLKAPPVGDFQPIPLTFTQPVTPLPPTRQLSQAFSQISTSQPSTVTPQPEFLAATNRMADRVEISQEPPTTDGVMQGARGRWRGRPNWLLIAIILTIVLLLISGSLAFALQQNQPSGNKTGTTTHASTGVSTGVSSNSPIGSGSPTALPKHTPSPTAKADPTAVSTSSPTATKTLTPTPTFKPSPTVIPVPPALSVSPSSLYNNFGGCSSETHGGVGHLLSCPFVLSNSTQTKSTLNWSASTSAANTIFVPSSGTIAPGQTASITMETTTGGPTCPFNMTFVFTGSANSVQVPIICTQVYASPDGFSFDNTYCSHSGNWVCVITVSTDASNTINTFWNVSLSTPDPSITFSQTQGTLTPGASVQVTITILSTDCPGNNSFYFSVPGGLPDGTANYLGWSC